MGGTVGCRFLLTVAAGTAGLAAKFCKPADDSSAKNLDLRHFFGHRTLDRGQFIRSNCATIGGARSELIAAGVHPTVELVVVDLDMELHAPGIRAKSKCLMLALGTAGKQYATGRQLECVAVPVTNGQRIFDVRKKRIDFASVQDFDFLEAKFSDRIWKTRAPSALASSCALRQIPSVGSLTRNASRSHATSV